MRRVVTGVNSSGVSVFTRDDESPHYIAMGNFQMGELWWESTAVISDGVSDPADGRVGAIPKTGEALVRYVVFPPQEEMRALMEGAVDQASAEQVSDDFHHEEDNPGMHTTETVDYGFVLSGELILELDQGEKKVLKAGDCYVQNGTRHAWNNESDQQAVLGVVMLGADRAAPTADK